jgi:acyl carrier protein
VTHDEIKDLVRTHIAEQILGGEDPANLTDSARLVSEGIVDSLASLRLVSWLEERFGVKIEAHEVDVEHLDTLDTIAAMIVSKRA